MAKRGQAVRRSPTRSKAPTKRHRDPADVDLKKENATLRRELAEALEQQTATSEVLQVISSSPGELEPVFQKMLENATRVCGAKFGLMHLLEGDIARRVALYNVPAAYADALGTRTFRPHPKGGLGQVIRAKQLAHIADYRTNPGYLEGDPAIVALCNLGGARTFVGVPLLRDAELVGMIGVYRQEVRPFTDKQIELLGNFAKQAVIAIENARLLKELRQRTDDLTESLEQQTATSGVLEIISSSPGELEPVFQAMLENATRICEAKFGTLYLSEGDGFRAAAMHNAPPAYKEARAGVIVHPPPYTGLGRAAKTKQVVQVADITLERGYIEGDPFAISAVTLGGYRSVVSVPMLHEDQLIGVITIFRQEVRSFTDKQIELLTNFAAQAVIAIENTRLLRELRDSLQQQTATADVLKIISSSPGELEPVFSAILENAAHLCEAKFGHLFLSEGDEFRVVALQSSAANYPSWLKRGQKLAPLDNPHGPLAQLARTKKILHVTDLSIEQGYIEGNARMVALVKSSGARTFLGVPMFKEEALIGAIAIYRQEVRPFTDKQIELVENFAAQAVIAIENTRLLDELRESLQQQTATADVLKAISRSTFDLKTVLDALVEAAALLCKADQGGIARERDGLYQRVATYGLSDDYTEYLTTQPVIPQRGTGMGRALLEGKVVHIPDVQADPDYTFFEAQRRGGFRTVLGVPMLREGVPIGVLALTRREVRPFTDKQIELVTTFADQAAIAIENVRLFEEVQAKTRDLSEALTYQTGSASILSVIASSPTDVGPVLKAIVESACELCEAYDAIVLLEDGDGLRISAHHGPIPLDMERWPLSRNWVSGRAFLDRKPIHVHDLLSAEGDEFPDTQQRSARTGARSMLCVPLLREGKSIGTIVLRRTEVHPFSDKQIALLQTFADQAVIAIGNVRMFEQVQERTKELLISLDDLRTAQDRLIQTEKLASLGQLTAGIAHEIKNPLNFVNNFSALSMELVEELKDVLKPATLDNKTREETSELTQTLMGNLEKVVQHGKRADAIVKNMLLHSRQGSGEHRPVDINALVEESLNLAYHGARAEKPGFNITLKRSFDPNAGEVDVFPQEITRVFLNLISNGFYAATTRQDHADGDGYEPTLAAVTKNLGDSVEIRIRDSGTGIPPEVKEKMFNPFFTTKPAGEGTGLGLSLSYDIVVKQHTGSIEVDTQPGEFTEFKVILPRKAALNKVGVKS